MPKYNVDLSDEMIDFSRRFTKGRCSDKEAIKETLNKAFDLLSMADEYKNDDKGTLGLMCEKNFREIAGIWDDK